VKAAADPLQEVFYRVLSGDTGVGGLLDPNGSSADTTTPRIDAIRDVAAASDLQGRQTFPYVTIGVFNSSANSTFASSGERIRAVVAVWTKTFGMQKAYAILRRLNELLGDAKLDEDPGVIGYQLVRVVFNNYTPVADPENGVEHVTAEFDVFLQEQEESVAQLIQHQAATSVAGTSSDGGALTLTLPAPPAGKYHHITSTSIQMYATAASTGGATPVVVTTTNLYGVSTSLTTARAIGSNTNSALAGGAGQAPWRSELPATASTVVCPATTGVIWRVTINYFESSAA